MIPSPLHTDNPMTLALAEAEAAAQRGEVPVGAVIVEAETGRVIARTGNRMVERRDPTAHAEMLAIQEACAIKGAMRLTDCDLYVTLEPCAMCAAAISLARLRRLHFAAYDPKGGGVDHGGRFYQRATCHHAPEVVGGIEEVAASRMLRDFFAHRRGED